jgi:hypothetical protein
LAERFYPDWFIDIYRELDTVIPAPVIYERFHHTDDFSGVFTLSVGQIDVASIKPIIPLAPFEAVPADHSKFHEALVYANETLSEKYRIPDMAAILGVDDYNKWLDKKGLYD